ncbi:Vacuolar protein-sorting-associated protein 36 [Lodderomyces elongisporus]|uniref:Vacuolar protein-sorting-associated protein 36 n=1 Tax=Lodderomyces elongisporus TaxID=36914 RepID=UPI00291E7F65|nr:Vacuolar protein-sorting-associated protein 36 [Lodderomyces elongisporus]WLF77288.1 Vacuolar protein-sorting-associated protein 36 [Lodderomyces elongisporus]
MTWLKLWRPIKINRSNRPILDDLEHSVYVKDNVGLYQGKAKITNHQNGRLYLTNKRIIYFDNDDCKNQSAAVDIRHLTSAELIDGFLRSSPKVKLFIKTVENDDHGNGSVFNEPNNVTWVCKICSFNNVIEGAFNLNLDEMPKCIACGVHPSRAHLENALENARSRPTPTPSPVPNLDSTSDASGYSSSTPSHNGHEVLQPSSQRPTSLVTSTSPGVCPVCTFHNHKSIKFCEMCGAEVNSMNNVSNSVTPEIDNNPLSLQLESPEQYTNGQPYIKISFRKGGEKEFFQRVANIIDEIKWENLKKKGGINQDAKKIESTQSPTSKKNGSGARARARVGVGAGAGLSALEQIGEQQRKKNELILSTSLDDLEQLMFKFKDLMNISSSLSHLAFGQRKTVLSPLNVSRSSKIYHQELSRHISEYLTSYKLTKSTAMITLQDLFADYNRDLVKSSGYACELIDASDFKKSIDLFQSLNLPVVQDRYENSDLVVVKPKIHADTYGEFIVKFLQNHEQNCKEIDLRRELIDDEITNEGMVFEEGCYGSSVTQISHAFNWSYNITLEELDKSVKSGEIVIDQSISGTFYYVNKFRFSQADWHNDEKEMVVIKNSIVDEQKKITMDLKRDFKSQRQHDLISLQPNYEFGAVADDGGLSEEFAETPPVNDIPLQQQLSSIHLNDLQGLKF